MFFNDNAVRVATIRDASKMLVREIVGESRVGAKLFKASLAVGACTVRVNQAADCSEVAGLEFRYCGADLGYTTNDFVSRNTWICSGHHAPFVTDLMEVGVADAAEKDFDLNIIVPWLTARDLGWRKRGCCTSSGIGLRFILTTQFRTNLRC